MFLFTNKPINSIFVLHICNYITNIKIKMQMCNQFKLKNFTALSGIKKNTKSIEVIRLLSSINPFVLLKI